MACRDVIVMARLVGLLALAGGCYDDTSVPCGDKICPRGSSCVAEQHCVLPEQLAQCAGVADGIACSTLSTGAGVCFAGACIPPDCGNQIVEPPLEFCDDGNKSPGDGCRADCSGPFTRMLSGTTHQLAAVWGASTDDVFAVGNGRILHYDGTAWQRMSPPEPAASYFAVCGYGSSEVYAAGSAGVDRYDGTSWSPASVPAGSWFSLDCTPGGVVAIAYEGLLAQGRGSTWTVTMIPATGEGVSAWARAPDDIYITRKNLGQEAYLSHFDGSTLADVISIPGAARIWGTSPTDIYLVANSEILRFDGSSLQRDPGGDEIAVYGFGGIPGNVYGVGALGAVRFDGTQWRLLPLPVGVDLLLGVWSPDAAAVFAVGEDGAIVY